MSRISRIELVVFDWAGTTVDHGCFAPVAAFMKVFESRGVPVTVEQARAPMGLEKRAHIQAMIGDPAVGASWLETHGRSCSVVDVDEMYEAFVPMQLDAIRAQGSLIPGAVDVLQYLRRRGTKTGGTTGYFESAARLVEELARSQGFTVDANAWAAPGEPGRPGPALMQKLMRQLSVERPESVLKIGDTVHDVAEGLNAGTWSVAVLRGSSEIGLSASEYDTLLADERAVLLRNAGAKMLDAGAHAVIESLADVPELIGAIERELERGVRTPRRI